MTAHITPRLSAVSAVSPFPILTTRQGGTTDLTNHGALQQRLQQDAMMMKTMKEKLLRVIGNPLLTFILLILVALELSPLFRAGPMKVDDFAFHVASTSTKNATNGYAGQVGSTESLQYSSSSAAALASRSDSERPTLGMANATIDQPQSKLATTTITTKIVGFTDYNFRQVAQIWYQELTNMGYTEHVLAAHDSMAVDYFRALGMRVEWVNDENHDFSILNCSEYQNLPPKGQRTTYRRSIFASRWNYVLRQLESGRHHILMSDVDNVFTQYKSPREYELEQNSEFDVFLSYAGTVPSFPKFIFNKHGFSVCGCLSWWRATPAAIQMVRAIVDKCHCQTIDCNCYCDDQVVLNNIVFNSKYKISWNRTNTTTMILKSHDDIDWDEELVGVCNATGHKVKLWTRSTAYRGPTESNLCPAHHKNWVAMPNNPPRDKKKGGKEVQLAVSTQNERKVDMRRLWNETCGVQPNIHKKKPT